MLSTVTKASANLFFPSHYFFFFFHVLSDKPSLLSSSTVPVCPLWVDFFYIYILKKKKSFCVPINFLDHVWYCKHVIAWVHFSDDECLLYSFTILNNLNSFEENPNSIIFCNFKFKYLESPNLIRLHFISQVNFTFFYLII